ncbi:MAG: toxin-antitoxin system HicB family antitoxin [Planctomycetes bacterium]|nr:toxin-antitoxin system HicB family antitoxin [Planctomycetota bacterium]
MAKNSVLTIRVPSDLKHRIEAVADSEGVSINQLAMYMFTREISSFEAGNKMSKYWEGYRKEDIVNDFDAVMIKVKKQNVPDWDKIKH